MKIGFCEKCNKNLEIISSSCISNIPDTFYPLERYAIIGVCGSCGDRYSWEREYRLGNFIEYDFHKIEENKE